MRLHVKLALILTGSMVVLLSIAQTWQVTRRVGELREVSDRALALLEQREEINARNVARAAEYAVAGSLERGEMEKFSRALEAQRDIEGLLEFSLFSQSGEIVHSTDPERLGTPLPDDRFDRNLRRRQFVTHDDHVEVFVPQAINEDCRRCHVDWPRSGFGGGLYVAFSREAVTTARADAVQSMSEAKRGAIREGALLVTVLCLVLAGLVHVFLGRPLARFVGMFDHFRTDASDLTYRIAVNRRDEIGRLGETLNSFLDQVHGIIRSAASGAERVQEHSANIARTNDQMAREMESQRDGTLQIAHSTEEMAATSREVARRCSELSDTAQATGAKSERGAKVTRTAATSMRELATSVTEAATLVDVLGEHSRSIGGVVELIESIAGQTNLLALNATIEAARAGEHGRGFAVVAEEVRALAQRTQHATEEISRSIEEMRSVTERSVQQMGVSAERAEAVLGLAEEAGQVLEEINVGTAEFSSAIQNIAVAAEQQSAATNEIATAVDSINTSATEASEGARRSAETSRELRQESEALHEQIGRFRI